ncbi:SET domain-containing protein-lysine N-methyltransferase [Kitasatospora sp. NPDC057904]|uniref:SET domain-containing protein-lysine N-methyltransferase n=1 Tax=unclassified Kitasatospora TaxID=2633591 RepID=UPI0036DF2DC9
MSFAQGRSQEASSAISPTAPEAQLGVLRSHGDYSLVALGHTPAGSRIFGIDGRLTDVPSRHSVQVGHRLHVDLPHGMEYEDVLDAYFWRFMNHSCEPTARIDGRQVVAVTDLLPGQEITFHYNTTEAAMAEPFDCRCGSESCEGHIAGYYAATPAARLRLGPWLGRHLSTTEDDLFADDGSAGADAVRR